LSTGLTQEMPTSLSLSLVSLTLSSLLSLSMLTSGRYSRENKKEVEDENAVCVYKSAAHTNKAPLLPLLLLLLLPHPLYEHPSRPCEALVPAAAAAASGCRRICLAAAAAGVCLEGEEDGRKEEDAKESG